MNNLTILIPTHNRHCYLKRALEYYKTFQIKSIIVVDSSSEKFESFHEYDNLQYVFLPKYELIDKICLGLDRVTTENVSIVADDDFLVESGLEECNIFLKSNFEYVSVQGSYVAFQNRRNKVKIFPQYLSTFNTDYADNNVVKRFEKLLGKYMHLSYSVYRLTTIKSVMNKILDSEIKDYILMELLVAILLVIEGKHKQLPVFYNARESIYNSYGRQTLSIKEIFSSTEHCEHVYAFKSLLLKEMKTQTGIDDEVLNLIINKNLKIYMKSEELKFFNNRFFQKISQVLQTLLKAHRIKNYPLLSLHKNSEWKKIERMIKTCNCFNN